MASRDVAMAALPMVQPMAQPLLVRPEAVGVSAMLADATLSETEDGIRSLRLGQCDGSDRGIPVG